MLRRAPEASTHISIIPAEDTTAEEAESLLAWKVEQQPLHRDVFLKVMKKVSRYSVF